MVTPLRQQTTDEPRSAPLRYSAAWDLAGIPVTDARDAVRALLARVGHGVGHRSAQDAQLVVSELITNAVRHAPGPGALLLELSPGTDHLKIVVRDSSPHPPVLRARDPRRVGGHGLHLVTLLCEQLRTVRLRTGKQVVAHLSLRAAE
ncbi:ATP-binding protein [Streptomyces sp. NPDC017936]|uniref:ATP-binding protein n=1 Tax=Streptomyces sp. NPDC017936 TaxID=3365016 RepID=UPI003799FAF6